MLMDNSWVPADFVERTLAFYADPARAKSLLAYPERFFQYTGSPTGGRGRVPTAITPSQNSAVTV